MSSIKQKLHSKTGASMLLALMFMMVCLFIGGTVLASATANGRRVANMQSDEQEYLSQRSAMLLLADMLQTSSGDELSLIIKDETVENLITHYKTRTVTFSLPDTAQKPVLQKILYENVLSAFFDEYRKHPDIDVITIPPAYEHFNFEAGAAIDNMVYTNPISNTGYITVTADLGNGRTEDLTAKYEISNFNMKITFGTMADGTFTEDSVTELSLEAFADFNLETYFTDFTNADVTVVGPIKTTTKTSIISWEDPVIKKVR